MSDPEARESRVRAAVESRREVVNAAVDEELPVEEPRRLYEASRYLLDAGGKRLRPVMLLLVAEALSGVGPDVTGPAAGPGPAPDPATAVDYRAFPTPDGEAEIDLLTPAVSVEAIQSFTLIHDDIMDDDGLRRGVPAVHREYDVDTAILAGDTLYSKAFELMVRSGAPHERSVEAVEILATTCTEICEGQALDVEFEDREDVTPEEYLRMVEQKTAMLYAASAAIPAVLLGAEPSTVDEMFGFGLDVGRAFQIRDDVLDVTVPSEQLGKQRGSDLVENKMTAVTVHARNHGVDVASLVDADEPEDVTEAEVERAVERLREVGSIEHADSTAREFVESGKDRLRRLPDNGARALLADLADYLIERGY